jgi:hypothetical protein
VGYRRYSDEEKAAALVALAANGGDVSRTARQIGIPINTIANWSKGMVHPAVTKIGEEKKPLLADLFESFVGRVLALTTDADIQGSTLKDRFTAAGIAIDKARLLRGEPGAASDAPLGDMSNEQLQRIAREEADARRGRAGDPPPPGGAE